MPNKRAFLGHLASTIVEPTGPGFLTLADLEFALSHGPEFTSVQDLHLCLGLLFIRGPPRI